MSRCFFPFSSHLGQRMPWPIRSASICTEKKHVSSALLRSLAGREIAKREKGRGRDRFSGGRMSHRQETRSLCSQELGRNRRGKVREGPSRGWLGDERRRGCVSEVKMAGVRGPQLARSSAGIEILGEESGNAYDWREGMSFRFSV